MNIAIKIKFFYIKCSICDQLRAYKLNSKTPDLRPFTNTRAKCLVKTQEYIGELCGTQHDRQTHVQTHRQTT